MHNDHGESRCMKSAACERLCVCIIIETMTDNCHGGTHPVVTPCQAWVSPGGDSSHMRPPPASKQPSPPSRVLAVTQQRQCLRIDTDISRVSCGTRTR